MRRVERAAACGLLAALALLPVIEALCRGLGIALPSGRALLCRLFLAAGFFAALITSSQGGHISVAVVQFVRNERVKAVLAAVTSRIAAVALTVMAFNAACFVRYGLRGPDQIAALVMPAAFAVMAIRCANGGSGRPWPPSEGSGGRRPPVVSLATLLLGTFASLPAIAKLIWGFAPPEPFFTLVNTLYDAAYYGQTLLILCLILAALAGAPIFACIGGIALVLLQALGGEPDAAPIQIYSSLTDTDLVAIPLFTLTGFFLSESRAGERLVATFKNFFSVVPGGMVIATVVICAFFTSFTGASGVTILALGGILHTILARESGYPDRFSVGLLTSTGGVGLLFPPSLPIILVGATTSTILHFMGAAVEYTILHYFLGALIPGVILVTAMSAFGIASSLKTRVPVERFDARRAAASLRTASLELLLPAALIALYFTGTLSLVEIAAVSVVYVFIAEVLIHRDIPIRAVGGVFMKALPIIGGILAIIATAKALSYAIIDTEIPERFTAWMRDAVESPRVFLLLLNLALLAVGCLMDIFSAILVVLPLIVPLGVAYNVDPVHLGVIFITNLEVGFLTPPVGMNLFLAAYRFERPFVEICRDVFPFLLIQVAVVLLVTYAPALSTWLPSLF